MRASSGLAAGANRCIVLHRFSGLSRQQDRRPTSADYCYPPPAPRPASGWATGGYKRQTGALIREPDDYGHTRTQGGGGNRDRRSFSYPPSFGKQLFQAPPPGRGVHGHPGVGCCCRQSSAANVFCKTWRVIEAAICGANLMQPFAAVQATACNE